MSVSVEATTPRIAPPRRSSPVPALGLLLAGAVLALLLAIGIGSVPIGPAELWAVAMGGGDELHRTLLFELRLPRALAAFATGGLLGVAGALMQVLLRNPLADPYVLGLSGGASVGALGAMLLGAGAGLVTGSALLGALLSILLVFGLAHGSGSWTPTRLLLTGVVVASGWGAIITFLLAIAPADRIPGMLYWLMGDLIYARSPRLALFVLALACVLVVPLGRALNVLARGPLQAAALGVAVRPLTWTGYLLA
ncbi:MAG: iron ABC transporter permease, partial [Gammaproteobacteria bacterium]|nr:iron ABC transporter permease [Gammaproteobacteria bacterium]